MSKKCQNINIVMGSVRAAHFTGPLDSAASSFYDLYQRLMTRWNGKILNIRNQCICLNFGYFNAVPSDKKPRADLTELENANVFIIVVENEYQYANGKINPMYRQYLDDRLLEIRKRLRNKIVIILNSDIQHTPDLIWNYTLAKIPLSAMHWIEENDIPGNFHTLKYYNLRNFDSVNRDRINKEYDFAYWGSYRADSPERQQILTKLRKNYPELEAFYLGHLPPFTDQKWTRKFIEAVPRLSQARSTICFGVDENPDWLTAKYHEALGMRIIPFVWKNYDVHRKLGEIDWQIVDSLETLVDKIYEIRDPKRWSIYWNQIENSYLDHILREDEIYTEWENRILPLI